MGGQKIQTDLPSMEDVTICECIDGLHAYPATPTTLCANRKWHMIGFSDVTISMLEEFLKTPHGEEVIECLRQKDEVPGAIQKWSFTQILAMEAAQKIAWMRNLGHRDRPGHEDTWLVDLCSFQDEFARIATTGAIYLTE